MTSNRLRVFVSSSMTEFKDVRTQINAEFRKRGIDAWVFEVDAGARNVPIKKTFLDEVEAADVYVGIFWKVYGRYTIQEFEHAEKRGIPCLFYEKRTGLAARDPMLQEFLDQHSEVDSGLTIKWFDEDEELVTLLYDDVQRLLTENFRGRARQGRAVHFVDRPPVAFAPAQCQNEPQLQFDREFDSSRKGQTLDSLFDDWIASEDSNKPLAIVAHFAPDVRESLVALAGRNTRGSDRTQSVDRVQWVYGEKLVELAETQRQQIENAGGLFVECGLLLAGMLQGFDGSAEEMELALGDLSRQRETLVVLDFSDVAHEISEASRSDREKRMDAITRAIRQFSKWPSAEAPRHKFVVGIPRSFLRFAAWKSFVDATHCRCIFTSTLFSDQIEDGEQFFESQAGFPPPEWLATLINANSSTLLKEIIHFFKVKNKDDNGGLATSLIDLLELAKSLYSKRYFEIAYRLELYCRTRESGFATGSVQDVRMVAMEFEVLPVQSSSPRSVSTNGARLNGQELIPQAIRQANTRALIGGDSGGGKSYALQQVEGCWCLPPRRQSETSVPVTSHHKAEFVATAPLSLRGRRCPSWLPVYLPLSGACG